MRNTIAVLTKYVTRAVIAIGILTPAAFGQIDKRVNTGNLGAGYAKDANPMVGSGGINLSRPGMNDAGVFSNAIITGNVTGLAGFRGDSPIQSINQFRDALPSAGLSGFLARSVAAGDVAPNSVQTPSLFFGRPETVTDAGFVRQGYNVAQSVGTLSQNIVPTGQRNTTFGSGPLTPPDPTDRRVQGPAQVDTIGLRQKPIGRTFDPSAAKKAGSATGNPFDLAVSSPIFGAPPRGAGGMLSNNPLAAERPRDILEELGLLELNAEMNAKEEAAKSAAGLNRPFATGGLIAKGKDEKADDAGKFEPHGMRQRDFTGQGDATDRMAPTAERYGADAPVNLGADRFADLYNAFRTAEQFGVSQFGFEDKPEIGGTADARSAGGLDRRGSLPGADTIGDPIDPEAKEPDVVASNADRLSGRSTNVLRRRASDSIQQLASKAKWASDTLDDPIATFAGHYENDLNRIIIEAEGLLHKGEYYRAANQFQLACTIDPRNPLPYLGRGHAWLAAGDYSSGLASVLAGIDRFPQIAAFRLDLPGLVGNRDVFDRRRADLAKKLERREDYELRFILGYLELYSGLSAEGLQDIAKAAESAPADSTITRFNDLLHDRGQPTPLPQE